MRLTQVRLHGNSGKSGGFGPRAVCRRFGIVSAGRVGSPERAANLNGEWNWQN